MSDNGPTVLGSFGEAIGVLVEMIWGGVKVCFFAGCVIYPLIWLAGHYGLSDAEPPTPSVTEILPFESFAVYALREPNLFSFALFGNPVTCEYLGEGELRNVELTIKVTLSNAEVHEFKQYKGSWSTNEKLRITVPVAIPIELIEIQGFGYRNDQRVGINHSVIDGAFSSYNSVDGNQ